MVRDDEAALFIRLMGLQAQDLAEVVWDEAVATTTPLSAACVRLQAADMSGDAEAVTMALNGLAKQLQSSPELVHAAYERLERLRGGFMEPLAPPRGLFRRCFAVSAPDPPRPMPFAWFGSHAQDMFLAAVRTGLRHDMMDDDVPVPVQLLQLLAPAPLTALPRKATGADVLAMAGDWCRANAPRFRDVATKVGMRVAGKVLRRRRLLQLLSAGAAGACSRPA